LVASSGFADHAGRREEDVVTLQPTGSPRICAVNAVDCLPVLPVKALALPEFTTSARADAPLDPPRFNLRGPFHRRRGAFRFGEDAADRGALVHDSEQHIGAPLVTDAGAAVASFTPAISGMAGTSVGARGETRWTWLLPAFCEEALCITFVRGAGEGGQCKTGGVISHPTPSIC
jgi:hypothetical protein